MVRSPGPENSIDQIEAFILQHFPNNETCYHMPSANKSYVFCPGHRIRIADFVKDQRAKLSAVKLGEKRARSTKQSFSKMPKCVAPHVGEGSSEPSSLEEQDL